MSAPKRGYERKKHWEGIGIEGIEGVIFNGNDMAAVL